MRLLAVVFAASTLILWSGAGDVGAKPRPSKPTPAAKKNAMATYSLLKKWDDGDGCKDKDKDNGKDKCPAPPTPPPPPSPPPPPAPPDPPAPAPPPPRGPPVDPAPPAPLEPPAPPPPPPSPAPEPAEPAPEPPAQIAEPDPTPAASEESSADLSPVEPIAPPGAENTWVEPMPAAPQVSPHADDHGSTEGFAPLPEATFPEAPAFSAENSRRAPDASVDPVPNGGFDHSASGWHGSNSALTLVRGRTGRAVRVNKANSRDAFAIVAGKPIASLRAGVHYRAGAFVRSVSPGMFVCLRVEEFGTAKTVVPVTTERCRAATTGWQRLRVDTRTTAKGTKLVFSIRVIAALGGTSFDVDGFRLS